MLPENRGTTRGKSLTTRAAHRPFDGDGRKFATQKPERKRAGKNGRRRIVRPFAQPFDVYYFFHNFYVVFGYLVDVISDIEHEY